MSEQNSAHIDFRTVATKFFHALFWEKNYDKAFALCAWPINITYQYETVTIRDIFEFRSFLEHMSLPDVATASILDERIIFSNDEITTIYLELRFGSSNNTLSSHFTVIKDGICSIHCIFSSEMGINRCTKAEKVESNKLVTALNHTGMLFWEYHPFYDRGTIDIVNSDNQEHIYNNFTEMLIRFLNIAPSSHQDLINTHEAIIYGQSDISTIVKIINADGDEEWRKIKYSTIQSENNIPIAIGSSENINELKQLEKRFSVATAQTGVSIWNYDLETRTLSLENNPDNNFFQQTNFVNTPECFFENNLVHPEDIETFREIFQRIAMGESLINAEIRFKSKISDEFIWHQIAFSVALDADGYPNSVIGTSINIHTQKTAEKKYKEELKLLETENSSSLLSFVYSINEQHIVRIKSSLQSIDNNIASFEELRDKLIKLSPNIEHKKLLLDTLDTNFLVKLITEQVNEYKINITLNTENEESVWANFDIQLMKNPATLEMYAKFSVDDITADYISDAYIDTLTEQKYDSVARINYVTGKYLHFADGYMNHHLKNIPLTGNYHHDTAFVINNLIVEEEREAYAKAVSINNIIARHKSKGDFDILYRVKRHDGTTRFKRTRIFMLDENTHTFCTGTCDITAMHEQERERNDMLRQSLQLARQANQAKSSFLASMSHDIRTPMNAIIGMANLAIEDKDNKAQVAESLNVIKSSSEHLLTLINDILEMNRLESGNVTLSKEPFNLTEECTNIANAFKGIVVQKQQEFIFEMHNMHADHVIGDISNFKRILNNILGNAIKFTPKNGTIYFRIYQEDTNQENVALYKIEIQDTGVGIAEDLLPKIFEPFQREQSDTIKNIEGTGLGLAIVKALVERQGGAINVTSQKGIGTTFTLHISFKRAEKTEDTNNKNKINIADIHLDGKKILLVEDHPVNVLVASKLLQKMGATVVTAENGKIGLELFEQSLDDEYDLIFMDLQMPVMNGLDATKAIRASSHPRAKEIPIVAMTANAFSEDVHNSLNAGMNAHIAKPITMEAINTTLKMINIIP